MSTQYSVEAFIVGISAVFYIVRNIISTLFFIVINNKCSIFHCEKAGSALVGHGGCPPVGCDRGTRRQPVEDPGVKQYGTMLKKNIEPCLRTIKNNIEPCFKTI